MKKVFLSLATIAFVAVGSLTVTSCGGDDSTATPPVVTPPPGGDDDVPVNPKAFKVGETVYALDIVESRLATTTGTSVKVFDLELSDGSKVRATRWDVIAFNGTDMATSENYHQARVFIPVGADDAIVTPTETESFIFGGSVVYAGNASTALTLGQTSAPSLGFDVYVDGTDTALGKITYGVQFTSANHGVIALAYSGDMDGTFLVPDATAPKSGVFAKATKASGLKVNASQLSTLKTVEGGSIKIDGSLTQVK